jgi:DNA-binding LacI/PurR family transcriptional regulator
VAEKQKSRPTYAEIAKLAGVSEATVSRVLNGDKKVDAERIKAVTQAVDKLGYKKNRAAAALASGRTGLIAVVIDDDLSVFQDPFWGAITNGISRVLMENEMQTLLLVAPLDKLDSPVAQYLQRGEVDGAIFLQLHKDSLIKKLAKQNLPLVVNGTPHTSNPFAYVDSDNAGGAYAAVKHLVSSGRKVIGKITGTLTNTAAEQRLDGYLAACRELGLPETKSLVAEGDWSREAGISHAQKLLKKHPDLDAIFCSNDVMALGAITALQEAGKSVPEDVAVIGFDDSYLAQNSHPGLTSVRQDINGLGMEAAKMILALLRGEEVHSEILPCELVTRETS